MIVQIYDLSVKVEAGDFPVIYTEIFKMDEVQPYIDLIRANGYETRDGTRYKLAEAMVTGDRVTIYVGPEPEPGYDPRDDEPSPHEGPEVII